MTTILSIAALGEGATGLLLLVYPPIVFQLLFGQEIAGPGVIMSRIAGISLIALGIACWPRGDTHRAYLGILTYSTLAMLYLIVTLPSGCMTPQVSGGGTYYLCGNTWFSPSYGANGVYYKVVTAP